MADKTIYVYEHWSSANPVLIGILESQFYRGQEKFSFTYDDKWLQAGPHGYMLDPELLFYAGRRYPQDGMRMFGIFADSCPDRWGRLLMRRRESIMAKRENRKPRQLSESDFLLGVYDEARMGALRFSMDEGATFLSNDSAYVTPPWVQLRTLENASLAFESDENLLNERWLNELLAPGSSLGGARPKATVQAPDGSLWIAKFPSRHDESNVGAWEKVAHDLAAQCGLHVPQSDVQKFSKAGSTFLVKRFDRDGSRRIQFESAMTLLGKRDGASAEDGSSYLDIAEFITENGVDPVQDLRELWSRIVFSMAISNTDDHLRNHGFLLTQRGWKLSPLYDVNPVPYGEYLSLNVNEADSRISIDLAIDSAEYFELKRNEAASIARNICQIVDENWQKLASKYGISRESQEYMRPAFEEARRGIGV